VYNYDYPYSIYESYTELLSSYLSIIFRNILLDSKKDLINRYKTEIIMEILYSYHTISNLIKLNNYRSYEDFLNYADGVASTAQTNAQNYADSLAVNYDSAGSAATAQSNSNSYTDTAISSGNVTAEPQYKGIKYSWYSEDTANYAWANSDSTVTAISWNTNYASAKVIVRLRNGNHSQVSEVLITLDSSNNIHITEYAVVTTNGSLGDISASVSGGNVNLLVTPTHNTGTDIVTHATLMAWGD